MSNYDFSEFMEKTKDYGFLEMIKAAEGEAESIDRQLNVSSRRDRPIGESEYRRLLGGFLFLLRYGRHPNGVSDWDLRKMKPAIESLVQREQLEPSVLDVFVKADKAGS